MVLSHNHYDHLDARTIEALPGKGHIVAAVPAGLGGFFRRRGYRDVRELRWWEETRVGDRLHPLRRCPRIHFSGRTPFDRNATLWASWAIASRTRKVFFAGDTGYGPVFGEIGRRIGPFDLALVPIGAYEPSSIMRPVHCNPEEAVSLGRDVGAATLVAMHWGSIVLTDEPAVRACGPVPRRRQPRGNSRRTCVGHADRGNPRDGSSRNAVTSATASARFCASVRPEDARGLNEWSPSGRKTTEIFFER